jgi:ribonucleoside-diphosphate reductase alpha chain
MERIPLHLTENAKTVLSKRYLKKDSEGKQIEKPEEMLARVAADIASAETAYDPQANLSELADRFYNLMASLEFLPNSPTLMNAGRELQQLAACFVLPVEDDLESIFESIKNTALIQQSGGGTGFSFSHLRPKNDVVKSTGGVASGPVSFMRVFNMATEVIKQGGTRRGANMGILRVTHPDIEEFIDCKNDLSEFNNFNISVALTEDFMQRVEKGSDYDLINPRTGEVARSLPARQVFDRIVRNAWRSGEPGVIFIDRINRDNPTPSLGAIESTNPCGETPLLPYEACNLGSLNLARMLQQGSLPYPALQPEEAIDWPKLARTVRLAVHFLDNVIDRSTFPLPEIDEIVRGNRKIGLGVMGWADLLVQLGIPYDSPQALALAERVMSFIQEEATVASIALADLRGMFPNFPHSAYAADGPKLRNATTTTIAPTGTLSILAGCSSGVEPHFALIYLRKVMDNTRMLEVNPYFEGIARQRGFYSEALMERIAHQGTLQGVEEIPLEVRQAFRIAYDISPEYHLRMQAAFQRHTQNAVSKTVNFPQKAGEEEVRKVFLLAYHEGCKGVTIYRDKSREEQVLNIPASEEGKTWDELAASRHKVARQRPKVTTGSTERVETPRGRIYVTVNADEEGICEVFVESRDQEADGLSRLISLALRAGVDSQEVIEQLWRCESRETINDFSSDGTRVLVRSIAQGVALAMGRKMWGSSYAGPYGAHQGSLFTPGEDAHPASREKNDPPLSGEPLSPPKPVLLPGLTPRTMGGVCPECGNVLEYIEGCLVCRTCGYSRCA